jgi:hypothetical protein
MGKLHGGSGPQRVDVSTYTSKKGREGVQINVTRDMALAAAADMHGPEWEAIYDVMAELLEREERGE